MPDRLHVVSLYEGFFAGGARILHTDVVAGLHGSADQQHSVLSLSSAAVRESTSQPMHRDPRYQRLRAAGVGVAALGRTAAGDPVDRDAYSTDELRAAARFLERADVILSLKEQPLSLLLALRDRGMMPDVPVAACLHRSDPTHSGPALGWLLESASTGLLTATIACAQSTSDAYARAGVRTARSAVIANGIDTERFRPGSADEVARTRQSLGIPASTPVVVYAARFDPMKNPGLFLRSVARHARRHPDTHYVMCGAGMTGDNPHLAALMAESGLPASAQVHTLGIRDDMPALYQAADIVALTSAFGEASPLCLLEGAACGATPVTTRVGDAARAVEGFGLVTAQSPSAIAGAWTAVLERRGEFRDAAIAARARLDRRRMVEDYRLFIEDVGGQERLAA